MRDLWRISIVLLKMQFTRPTKFEFLEVRPQSLFVDEAGSIQWQRQEDMSHEIRWYSGPCEATVCGPGRTHTVASLGFPITDGVGTIFGGSLGPSIIFEVSTDSPAVRSSRKRHGQSPSPSKSVKLFCLPHMNLTWLILSKKHLSRFQVSYVLLTCTLLMWCL